MSCQIWSNRLNDDSRHLPKAERRSALRDRCITRLLLKSTCQILRTYESLVKSLSASYSLTLPGSDAARCSYRWQLREVPMRQNKSRFTTRESVRILCFFSLHHRPKMFRPEIQVVQRRQEDNFGTGWSITR